MSPFHILWRLALSACIHIACIFYVLACLVLGHAVQVKPLVAALVLAWCVAPPMREARDVVEELRVHVRYLQSR